MLKKPRFMQRNCKFRVGEKIAEKIIMKAYMSFTKYWGKESVKFDCRCYLCMRCLQQCPVEDIQIGKMTEG